jgi:hypothetical protein
MIKFYIESLAPQSISGWAHNPVSGAARVEVTVALNTGPRTVVADLYRKHLEDAGIGDGHAGFSLVLGCGERLDPHKPIVFRSEDTEKLYEIGPATRRALIHDSMAVQFLNTQAPIFECVLVLIIKNEARYLVEWIEYHRILGVDHILVFDNGSTDSLRSILSSYEKYGLVTLVDWPNLIGAPEQRRRSGWLEQDTAYACAVRMLAGRARWIGCLDIDEFVVFEGGARRYLPTFLDSFGEPMVTLFWRLFGTSGIEKQVDGLVIEQFIKRAHDQKERLTKVFVRPDYVHRILNAHQFSVGEYRMNSFTTAAQKTFGSESLVASFKGASIHHYHTRSREEFTEKVRRGWPKNDDGKNFNWEGHFKHHDKNDVTDMSASAFGPEVKSRIKRLPMTGNATNSGVPDSVNWLLRLSPTLLHHVDVFLENGQTILEGYLLDSIKPNEVPELVIHDGYGNIFGSVICNVESQILLMNRISHSAHGFQFMLPAEQQGLDSVVISSKNFVRTVRLDNFNT